MGAPGRCGDACACASARAERLCRLSEGGVGMSCMWLLIPAMPLCGSATPACFRVWEVGSMSCTGWCPRQSYAVHSQVQHLVAAFLFDCCLRVGTALHLSWWRCRVMSLAQMLPKRKHSSKQPLRVQALTCWTTCELCFTRCGPLVFGFMPYDCVWLLKGGGQAGP